MSSTLIETEDEIKLDEKLCFLCNGRPAYYTTFTCDECKKIFWTGYLCTPALEGIKRDRTSYLKYFPAHYCL